MPTAPIKKIFVPAPIKLKAIRSPEKKQSSPENIGLAQRIAIERRQACQEMLSALDRAISDPLQTLLTMAELEKRDDYRVQVERILNTIRELQRSAADQSAPP